MKKLYKQPIAQDIAMELDSQILDNTSHIGEGGEGKEGDVKGDNIWNASKEGSMFNENPFK